MTDRRPYIPQAPRPPFNIKYHIPERKVDEDTVNRFFLLVEDGDIFRVKDYILSNNVTPNIRRDTGETLLHVVLTSANLSKTQKYDMCKFLIEQGTQVGLADSNNVTPLHLAAKLQLADIVELLIQHGALTNAFDNKGMTPLHYEVASESSTCKTERITKIGNFTAETANKEKYTEEVKDINTNLLDMMYQDVNINTYLSHIQSTLNNIQNMFPEELDSSQRKYMDALTHIITANDTTNLSDKSQKLINLTVESKNDISIMLSNKLKDTLSQMNIKPNTIDGWGPTQNQIDNILPFRNNEYIMNAVVSEKNKDLNSLSQKLRQIVSNISDRNAKLAGYYNDWINLLIIANDSDLDENNDYAQNNNMRNEVLSDVFSGNQPYTAGGKLPTAIMELQHDGDFDISKQNILFNDDNQQHIVDNINNGYIFVSLFKHYLLMVERNLRSIRTNVELLIKYLEYGVVYFTYDVLCTDLTIYVQNCIIYLSAIVNEMNNDIIRKLTNLQNENDTRNIGTTKKDIGEKISEAIGNVETGTTICATIYKSFTSFLDTLNGFVTVINMTSAIRYINQYHHYFVPNGNSDNTSLIEELYNRPLAPLPLLPTTFNEYRTRIPQIDYVNIQNDNMRAEIKKLLYEYYIPQVTYKNYSCYCLQDIQQRGTEVKRYNNANKLVDFNVPINSINKDLANHIDIINTQIKAENRCGILGYLPYINGDSFNSVGLDGKNLPILKYGSRKTYYKDDIPELVDTINNLGHFALRTARVESKKTMAYPVVGLLIDKHFYMLKFLMIQLYINYTAEILHSIRENKETTLRPFMNGLKTSLENYITKYRDELAIEDINDYVIYILIAKMVDAIIMNFIKGCINTSAVHHTTKLFDQVNNNPHYTQILQNIRNQKNLASQQINLLNPETNYKVDLNAIIEDVYTQFFEPLESINNYQLNYTDLLVKEKTQENKDQHIIYNYSFSTKQAESICYKVNPEIIDLLAKGNAQINFRDSNGNTPIYYAVEMQHEGTITKLLSYNASVNNKLSRNIIGITPFTHAINIYKAHLDIMQDPLNLTKSIYKNIEDTIMKKPEYKNNMLKYVNNIFPQILLMLNHHFYLLSKQYKKLWNYSDYKNLIKLLEKYKLINMALAINKTIPILLYYNFVPQTGTQTLNAREKYIEIELENKNTKLFELTSSNNSLYIEFMDIQRKKNDPYYKSRIEEIEQLRAELYGQIAQIKSEIDILIKKQEDNERAYVRLNNTKKVSDVSQRIKEFNPINIKTSVKLYNDIFTKVINYTVPGEAFKYTNSTDLDTYRGLWDLYINDDPADKAQDNITNLNTIVSKLQYIVINKYVNNEIDINELVTTLTILNALYTNIIEPFAKDYDLLPLEYNTNTNYALDIVINILIHTLRHTICVSLYNAITKGLTMYVMNLNTKTTIFNDTEYSQYIAGIVDNIVNENNNTISESPLMKYIMVTLPLRFVKITTSTYEGDDDPDRLINRTSVLFEPILNMLMINKTLPLDRSSSIITLFEKTLFPYFDDIMQLSVNEAKNMVDNYLRYSSNESRQIRIITKLANKASMEVK